MRHWAGSQLLELEVAGEEMAEMVRHLRKPVELPRMKVGRKPFYVV